MVNINRYYLVWEFSSCQNKVNLRFLTNPNQEFDSNVVQVLSKVQSSMKGTGTFSSPSVEMRLANGACALLKQGSIKARRLIMKGRLGEHWDQGL